MAARLVEIGRDSLPDWHAAREEMRPGRRLSACRFAPRIRARASGVLAFRRWSPVPGM